jgi:hypothetical protein
MIAIRPDSIRAAWRDDREAFSRLVTARLDGVYRQAEYRLADRVVEDELLNHLISRQSQALQRADALYRAVRFAGQVNRCLSWLTLQPDHLREAAEIVPAEISANHFAGLKLVSISRIIASERRSQDFDTAFRPLRDEDRTRWTDLAAARLLGAELPPVQLIQVQDAYVVRDGHCRISVACALGLEKIDACVTLLC